MSKPREFWAYKRKDVKCLGSNFAVELSTYGGRGSHFYFIEKSAYDKAIKALKEANIQSEPDLSGLCYHQRIIEKTLKELGVLSE